MLAIVIDAVDDDQRANTPVGRLTPGMLTTLTVSRAAG
jgi:hypothetical protein